MSSSNYFRLILVEGLSSAQETELSKPETVLGRDASGDLVFDTAAKNETLLLFCREGGLGNQRLSAEQAKKLAEKSGETASRGLAIKLFEKAKEAEKKVEAEDGKKGGKGTSAIHMVTFNVKERS